MHKQWWIWYAPSRNWRKKMPGAQFCSELLLFFGRTFFFQHRARPTCGNRVDIEMYIYCMLWTIYFRQVNVHFSKPVDFCDRAYEDCYYSADCTEHCQVICNVTCTEVTILFELFNLYSERHYSIGISC